MNGEKKMGGYSRRNERPARNGWAPGFYMCKCHSCGELFEGGAGADCCSDCAYKGMPAEGEEPGTEELLRRACGVPEGAVLQERTDGEVMFSFADEDGLQDGLVPPTAVVDYLCKRVMALAEELDQTRARRSEAVKLLEEKRVENQDLRSQLAKFRRNLAKFRRDEKV